MEFAEGVTRARGQARVRLVGLVMNAAATDWRAAIALLERVWPLEFARADRAELTGKGGGKLNSELPTPIINVIIKRNAASDKLRAKFGPRPKSRGG